MNQMLPRIQRVQTPDPKKLSVDWEIHDYTTYDKVCEWLKYIMLLEHMKGHLTRSGKVK